MTAHAQNDDREPLYICEECGAPIYQGDQYQPGGDANFCAEHAATLAEILAFWEDDVAGQEDHAAWPHEFNSIEDAHEHIAELRKRIAANGGDYKPLFTA